MTNTKAEIINVNQSLQNQTFEAGEEVNYYDDLYDTTVTVKILYKTGDGGDGTERYMVEFENGQERNIWSDKLKPISTKEVNEIRPNILLTEESNVCKSVMPKEICNLYSDAAMLRFTLNALIMQMKGNFVVGNAKSEFEKTKIRLDNIELKISDYEKSNGILTPPM